MSKLWILTGDKSIETSEEELNAIGDEWREMSISGDCVQLGDFIKRKLEIE